LKRVYDGTPKLIRCAQLGRITHDVQTQSSATEGYADSVARVQESYDSFAVVAHEGEADDVILLALEVVDGGYIDFTHVQVPQLLSNELCLPRIRSKNRNLIGGVTLEDQVRTEASKEGGFMLVRFGKALGVRI